MYNYSTNQTSKFVRALLRYDQSCNRAGGGAFTKGGVSCTVESVHSHMPRQEGEKEQAVAAVSRIYHYKGSLVAAYLHSRSR